MQNDGSRALLIGGGGVLGRRIGAWLVSHGVHTIVHGGRDKQQFRGTVAHLARISAYHTHSIWHPAHNHRKLYQKIMKCLPVDIMIILYGPYIQSSIARTTYVQWEEMAVSNFVFPSACIAANSNYLQQAHYGRVIGFASDYRVKMEGYTQIAAYAAAKWAFASTILSAAKQNRNQHAKYYLIAPGYINYDGQRIHTQHSDHTYSTESVADGVLALLDPQVHIEDGSVISIDKLVKTNNP